MFRDRKTQVIAASAGFWVWCALLSYPMIGSNADLIGARLDSYTLDRNALFFQAAGLLLFLALMFLAEFSRVGLALRCLSPAQMGILLIIVVSLLFQFHDDEIGTLLGIFYTCLLLASASMLAVLWTMPADDLADCMRVASVVLCLFGITAIVILGWPEERRIGNIQPNLFAAPLLAAFIFSQFHAGVVGIAVRALCIGMVALVSSRFALIGCVCALVIHELTFNPLSRWKIPALLATCLATVAFWAQIVSILALDDSSRDISSGFSGRDELWGAALEAIAHNPFGVGFKRVALGESGHNGYLKTILEFGVVGGGLIIFLIGSVVISSGVEAMMPAGRNPQEHRSACARFAGLFAIGFGGFFQPQLFNLGDAFGMLVLLLLFKPNLPPSPTSRRFSPEWAAWKPTRDGDALAASDDPLSRRRD